ncbi:MAG: hypothetical protein V1882_05585 [Candidatus Omnitrophota bacterium]
MKRSFELCVVVFFSVLVCAQGSSSAQVEESVQAGVTASVKGSVKATTPSERRAHSLKDGDAIFMGDKIETGEDGQLQIQLLDQTVFTLGPLSTIMVDEFLYDPQNAGVQANMVKGIFRAVSGKVAQKRTEDVEGSEVSDEVKAAPETSPAQVQAEAAALKKLMDDADATNVESAVDGEFQKQKSPLKK